VAEYGGIPVTYRAALLILAVAALVPASATAQFTTFVSPPRPNADSAKAATVAQRAAGDSIAHTTLTNMKAWVDSAAGVVETPADTTTLPAESRTTTTATATTSFNDGAVAPATASILPLLALLGLASLSLGIVMLARRPRA
jgi:hypothetical protein